MISKAEDLIMEHEGRVVRNGRHIFYECPAGRPTIGYGRNLQDRGLSEGEARFLLRQDIQESLVDLLQVVNCEGLSDDWLAALIDMRFTLGWAGFRGFRKFIAAANRRDVKMMAHELKDSKWHRQAADRVESLIEIFERES